VVALVASTTPDFNLGSSIVGLYTLPDGIPGQSDTPVTNNARHHARLQGSTIYNNNVTPGANVETYTGAAVTLPKSPSTYYLGVVVDPFNTLKQLSLPANRLELIHTVGQRLLVCRLPSCQHSLNRYRSSRYSRRLHDRSGKRQHLLSPLRSRPVKGPDTSGPLLGSPDRLT